MAGAIIIFTLLAIGLGLLLVLLARHFHTNDDPVVEAIEALLPQTQCAQCGYLGCKPYAEAIAMQGEAINRCPPGGEATIQALADLLGREPLALDPEAGEEKPPRVAYIVEEKCIGCKLCIQACPVDAILGTAKRMHTVIEAECTGCELCLAPCPVDCIDMLASVETHLPASLKLKVLP